jgi:hypothetical protein
MRRRRLPGFIGPVPQPLLIIIVFNFTYCTIGKTDLDVSYSTKPLTPDSSRHIFLFTEESVRPYDKANLPIQGCF